MLVHNEKVYVTGIPLNTEDISPLHKSHVREINFFDFYFVLSLILFLFFLLSLRTYVHAGWAAADSDWSGRTWGSPYAIAVLDIGGFILENQTGGTGPSSGTIFYFFI
jgi:hypothetical protein